MSKIQRLLLIVPLGLIGIGVIVQFLVGVFVNNTCASNVARKTLAQVAIRNLAFEIHEEYESGLTDDFQRFLREKAESVLNDSSQTMVTAIELFKERKMWDLWSRSSGNKKVLLARLYYTNANGLSARIDYRMEGGLEFFEDVPFIPIGTEYLVISRHRSK